MKSTARHTWKAVLLLFAGFAAGCAQREPRTPPRPFSFAHDHFAFANETVWNYADGRPQREGRNAPERRYTRRCFVMSRAAMQFWKFARFEPAAPKLSERELAGKIRQITRRPVWKGALPEDKRVVIPGYSDLFALSKQQPKILQANIGLGWPTYFRPGGIFLLPTPTRSHQARVHQKLQDSLALGQPVLLWMINFPSLSINHTVVVYGAEKRGERWIYTIYDPNFADAPKELEYRPDERTFSLEPSFYFHGGKINVRPVFLSPWQ